MEAKEVVEAKAEPIVVVAGINDKAAMPSNVGDRPSQKNRQGRQERQGIKSKKTAVSLYLIFLLLGALGGSKIDLTILLTQQRIDLTLFSVFGLEC